MGTDALLLLIAVAVLAAALVAAEYLRSRRPSAADLTRRTYIVHTTSHESLRGVLVADQADHLVLEQAAYLGANGTKHPVNGPAWVPKGNVAWLEEILRVEQAEPAKALKAVS